MARGRLFQGAYFNEETNKETLDKKNVNYKYKYIHVLPMRSAVLIKTN